MVNEVNLPTADAGSDSLSERLEASNRLLQEMQAEHRQLLIEMETLRARAAELTRLNVQQQAQSNKEQQPTQAQISTTDAIVPTPIIQRAETEPAQAWDAQIDHEEENEITDDKKETASYLQEKLNEISALKAQFKRVQHIVDTTNVIEKHIATKITQAAPSIIEAECATEAQPCSVPVVAASPMTRPVTDNAELLSIMLNTFTDFTSDLRGHAECLRAERDRIKTLKEDIIRQRQKK
ncbi:uncharacterized protein LOC115624887 [Scaptodrosophila lebanonensis]|uniref:Uncharacterized protein LOC115624887 n=1 Tax=Drosophila lebanonensis TaxID=7225 RepID=A0A6J2THV3_DROLE|nr:uncharacterized protein LOC115624887 [Scaptodrosophila lebanonensis]